MSDRYHCPVCGTLLKIAGVEEYGNFNSYIAICPNGHGTDNELDEDELDTLHDLQEKEASKNGA